MERIRAQTVLFLAGDFRETPVTIDVDTGMAGEVCSKTFIRGDNPEQMLKSPKLARIRRRVEGYPECERPKVS